MTIRFIKSSSPIPAVIIRTSYVQIQRLSAVYQGQRDILKHPIKVYESWCIALFSLRLICALCVYYRKRVLIPWNNSANVPFGTTWLSVSLRLVRNPIPIRQNSMRSSWWTRRPRNRPNTAKISVVCICSSSTFASSVTMSTDSLTIYARSWTITIQPHDFVSPWISGSFLLSFDITVLIQSV